MIKSKIKTENHVRAIISLLEVHSCISTQYIDNKHISYFTSQSKRIINEGMQNTTFQNWLVCYIKGNPE